ncbi:hypothetical protein JZ751_005652, partial [Albula glossodonta]
MRRAEFEAATVAEKLRPLHFVTMMERPGSCRPRPALCQLGKSPPSIGSPAGMKTETLKCFLSVGEKSQIPVYISTVDMRDWIISKAQSIPRERFYFDPQPVVERAVREIIEELAQPPTSPLQTVAEVVMDTFADLSCALLEGGEELSGRLLSDMAVAVTVSMLQELEGVEQCEVQCWRQVRPRLVGALCGELLETVSPKDLQRALRGKWDAESHAVTAAIITSVTAAVNSVLAQPDATPGSSLETAVDAAGEAEEVETMLVDVAAPSIQMETAADAAAEAEQVETVLVDLRTCPLLPSLCIDIPNDFSSKAEGPHIASPFPGSSTFRP